MLGQGLAQGLGQGLGQGMEFATRRDKRHLAGNGQHMFNRLHSHTHTTNGSSGSSVCIIPFFDLLRTVALSCQPHKTFYVPKSAPRGSVFASAAGGAGSFGPSESLAQGQGLGPGLGQGLGPGLGSGLEPRQGQGGNDTNSVGTHSPSSSSRRSGDWGEGEGTGGGEEGAGFSYGGSRIHPRDEAQTLLSRESDRDRAGNEFGGRGDLAIRISKVTPARLYQHINPAI